VSNPLAIAAVTSSLRNLLVRGFASDADVGDTLFTTLPLDKARTGTTNQINLFLYQTTPNAAWRNHDLPQVKPGETAQPPLPLDLHYLVTTFGRDNDDVLGHHLLGRAMSIFHDHPLLGSDEIRSALPDSDLDAQLERIRLTPLTLTLDELSKLWTAFQAQFRISAAYRASVVLIESQRGARTPLPVLTRDSRAQSDLTPPFPALAAVEPPNLQESARLGDVLTLWGSHLDGDAINVRFSTPMWDEPVGLAPEAGGTAKLLQVRLPSGAAARANWPAGFYGVAVEVKL
jgi:Pvc16 N-terminal domain